MSRTLIAGLALALSITFAGTASAADITIALPTLSLDSMPAFIAQDNGFFAKHGLSVDVVVSRGGGEAMKAFIAGDATIVAVGFPEIALMKGRGIDPQILALQTTRAGFALVARSDLGIKTIAGLKGKTIAVTSPGSLTEYLSYYEAAKQGWNPKRDITVISMGGPAEMYGALMGKKVDGSMLMEPFVSIGLRDGTLTKIVDMIDELDAFPTGPLVAQKSFIDKSPDKAKAIHDAMVDALHYVHDDQAGTIAYARKKFPTVDPALLPVILTRLDRIFSRDGNASRENIDRTEAICHNLGILDKVYPFEELVAPIARD